MEDIRWEKEMVRNSWAEQDDKRNYQEQGRGEIRSQMRKPPGTVVPCQMFLRGALRRSIEKVPRYVRHLLRIEHRMRREEMEEQFNNKSQQGWRFAADVGRNTDDKAGSEDRKRTSGGVFVAIDSALGRMDAEK